MAGVDARQMGQNPNTALDEAIRANNACFEAARPPGLTLARRIDEASRYVPLENLALSPQCGFACTMEGNLVSEEEQWAKLRLLVETARRVWK